MLNRVAAFAGLARSFAQGGGHIGIYFQVLLRRLLKLALGLTLGAVGLYAVREAARALLTQSEIVKIRSWILHLLKNRVLPSPHSARDAFRTLEEVSVKKSVSHAHAALAANRAQAAAMMRLFALNMGRRLFMLQKSRRDVEQSIAGNRSYYWLKDTDVAYSDEQPTSADLVGVVDVDYYLDMPQLLSSLECPVILYTMTPTTSGEPMDDGLSFYFDRRDRIHVSLSGGAQYVHELWNYGTDVMGAGDLKVFAFWRSLYVSYDVERRKVSKHSSLVALIPRHKWTGIGAWIAQCLECQSLERVKVNHGGWNLLKIQSPERHEVSISRVDSPVNATLSVELHEGICSTVAVSKIPITISMVESQVTKSGLSHAQSALLCAYYRDERPQPKLTVFPIERSINRFQWGEFDPDAKPSLHPFMTPMVVWALAPDVSKGNEQRCISERITKVAAPILPLTPQFIKYVDEFVTHMVKNPHTYVPVSEEAVWELQSRPAQRRNLEEASMIDVANPIVNAFSKKEAYAKYTDPRNISTINPKDKLEYSRIVYAIGEIMKLQPWYAFGHTPRETADRVVEVCRRARFVVPSDYSRLDGSISNLCRYLEQALFMRAFAIEYHDKVAATMKTQYNQIGRGAFGTRYETGYGRLSGSPETSVCNSLVTAFVPYMAFREMGLDLIESYEKLGVYGGDDGLTPDIDSLTFSRCASSIGLKLTAESVRVGCAGVHFLARFYTPEVWYGNPVSCCDLKRQLSKFHTCVQNPDLPEVKLIEKGFSYYLSDQATPILGPFVTKVKYYMDRMGIVINPEVQNREICSYNTMAPLEDQYPNEHHEWFDTWAIELFPAFDQDGWLEWLESTRTITEMLTPPCFAVPEDLAPPGVYVNGEIQQPVEPEVAPVLIDVTVRGSPSRIVQLPAKQKEQAKKKRARSVKPRGPKPGPPAAPLAPDPVRKVKPKVKPG